MLVSFQNIFVCINPLESITMHKCCVNIFAFRTITISLCNTYHHHSVLCLATMNLNFSRFQVLEIVCVGLSFHNHTVIRSSILSICLLLVPFPSIFPVVTKCSNSLLLILYPKSTTCLFLASLTSNVIAPVLSSNSSFLKLSTYEICSILRRNHISVGLSRFSISLLIVHASQPYINTCNM